MKKILLALGLWLGAATGGFAQGVLPVALQQQVDINGHPLAGALLFTFVQGTVAQQQNTFSDSGLTVLNPWPLAADQSGRFPMFYMAAGSTHARATDSSGNVLFDVQNMLVIGAAGGGGGGGGSVDPTTIMATGDLKVRYGTGALSGFVRANGLTIGSATSGATERANSDTQSLFVFLYSTDPNLVVSGGRTGNALNDFNANKTIALPDWRGRAIGALDDMGNTAAGRLTSTFFGTSATLLGAAGGAQSHTQSIAEMPSHFHTASIFDPGHSHTTGTTGGANISVTSNSGATVMQPGGNGTGVSGTGVRVNSGNGLDTVNSAGGGAAFTIVPPIMLATIYLKL